MSIPENPFDDSRLYTEKAIWQSCSKAWAKWILVYCSEADLGCEHADFKALKKLVEEVGNG
jgi:hypothetical protein